MEKNKTTEYFPHDCNANDDPKIMLMMAQLGLEAYGIYWILVEYLRQQPGYRAPMILLDALSRRFGSSKEKFEAVITKFSLFEVEEEYFFSPSLNRRMSPLDLKREKMKHNSLMRWNGQPDAKAMQLHSKSKAKAMQSRVEESRVEKSKVKKSKEENKNSLSLSFVSDEFKPVFEKWLAFKSAIGDGYKTQQGTQSAFNKLLKLSNNNPSIASQIVDQSISEEWKGLFPLKVTPNQGNTSGLKISTKYIDER
jgi:hypothetical protein